MTKSKKKKTTDWATYFDSMSSLAALPLADTGNGQKRIIGTATLLMTGLFITAKHLIEQYFKDHEKLDIADVNWTPKEVAVSFNLEVLQPLKGLDLVVWHIAKIHLVPNSDLAILVAERCSGAKAKEISSLKLSAQINLHMPAIGTRVASLGYPNTRNMPHGSGAASKHILAMRTSEGVIEDLQTDITQRSPRFQTNAPIDGGMSGGPVFNEQGWLCGINSTGFVPTDEHTSYASFAIPLHTAFMSRLTLNLNGVPTEITLLELCKQGYIPTLGLEHFITQDDEVLFDSRNFKCGFCIA